MSEVGIIGQMYEDRRTKKTGKLVERDEKYKTLLFEAPEGKTFNISFSGFKSNWRKLVTDDIEESSEVANSIPDDTETDVVTDNVEVVKEHREYTVNKLLEETTLKIIDYVQSFSNSRVSVKSVLKKNSHTVKVDNRRMLEVITKVRNSTYMICMSEEMYLTVKDLKYIRDYKFHDNWGFKISFIIDSCNLDDLLNNCKDFIVTYMCEN